MRLEPVDELRPGAAPVSRWSEHEPVAAAVPLRWTGRDDARPARGGRLVVDLGGRWHRAAGDPADRTFPAPGARAEAGIPNGLAWRDVVVPDNFGTEEEHSRFWGPMWYRRRFSDPRVGAPADSPPRLRVRFAAVDYLADVWFDGEHLGTHEGCFAPFGFDLTDRIGDPAGRGEHELVVCVQDPFEPLDPAQFFFDHRKRVVKGTLKYHDSRPGGLPGRLSNPLPGDDSPIVWAPEWGQSMTTGGIVGPVELVRTGELSLDGLFVTPLDHRTGHLHVAAVLTNHTSRAMEAELHLSCAGDDAALAMSLPPGPGRVDAVTERPDLERWQPVHSPRGRPALHDLFAAVVVDDRVTDRRVVRFGVRTARVVTDDAGHPRHMEVNGHPVFVKAVNYIPWQHFAEVGRAFYDRDLRMLADAHGNSVGVHAHVQSPHAYDAADAAGILVFQDFALQWCYDSGTATNPGFVDGACAQLADLAYLLHGHPSVVYYTGHNEPRRMFLPTAPEDDTPERDLGERHLDAALLTTMHAVDPSRHVHEASGIGDDAHSYHGSLAGGSMYGVARQPAWFVSEFGFWTVGPQASRFGDQGWPPDPAQMREWVSRLSFIASTTGFAGMPHRYPSLAAWAEATQEYGAALAKHQTEWFRIHRGAPFMGYRWHFWSDWWGYAGGGLVDVDRVTKRTYDAFAAASRPVLVTARVERSVFEPGEVTLPVLVVNDTHRPWRGEVAWEVREATSAVIAPDPDGFHLGPTPPGDGTLVAVPRVAGGVVDRGTLSAEVAAQAAPEVGAVTVGLHPGSARTVVFHWDGETNLVHLHCPAPGEVHPPGLHEVGW